MGVGAGPYMYVVVVQKFTFAISSPDEFLYKRSPKNLWVFGEVTGKKVDCLLGIVLFKDEEFAIDFM